MRSSFSPRLVNDPFGDPGLFVPFRFLGRALLFDMGDLSTLSSRDLLKVSHGFITHTHMDHFIGFDRLLRVSLGRDRHLHLFGPEGFSDNLEGKLRGYTWNLVDTGAYPLVIRSTDVLPDRLVTRRFVCSDRFRCRQAPTAAAFDGRLLTEAALTVSGVLLDHRIPCLGLALQERFHVHILADRVADLGAVPGPWL
ncbi:MAG: ribonuclease Z, partial [Desulfobacterales bacterium]